MHGPGRELAQAVEVELRVLPAVVRDSRVGALGSQPRGEGPRQRGGQRLGQPLEAASAMASAKASAPTGRRCRGWRLGHAGRSKGQGTGAAGQEDHGDQEGLHRWRCPQPRSAGIRGQRQPGAAPHCKQTSKAALRWPKRSPKT